MRTKKITQRQIILKWLKEHPEGLNSYDATYKVLYPNLYPKKIKQAPTRIQELQEEGYSITPTPRLADGSVNWVLDFIPEDKKEIIGWDTDTKPGFAIPIYESSPDFSNSPKPHDTATDVSLFQ